jgi:hypothetical protein
MCRQSGRNWLQVLFSNNWAKIPSQHLSRNQYLLIHGRCSYVLCRRYFVFSSWCAFCRDSLVRSSLLAGNLHLLCNIYKSLIDAERTEVCTCPHNLNFRVQRSSWLGLRVLATVQGSLVHALSINAAKMWWPLHHAWSTCVFVDEEAHVPGVRVKSSLRRRWYMHLLVC